MLKRFCVLLLMHSMKKSLKNLFISAAYSNTALKALTHNKWEKLNLKKSKECLQKTTFNNKLSYIFVGKKKIHGIK